VKGTRHLLTLRSVSFSEIFLGLLFRIRVMLKPRLLMHVFEFLNSNSKSKRASLCENLYFQTIDEVWIKVLCAFCFCFAVLGLELSSQAL
jgi:hypothetical protein